MIASWMMYALVVSALFGLAGAALERSLRFARQPGRWAFVAAMLASLVVPVVTRSQPGDQSLWQGEPTSAGRTISLVPDLSFLPGPTDLQAYDAPLLVLWIAGALLLVVLLFLTQRRVALDAAGGWCSACDGVPVVRTKSFGPAVVGCMKSVIVLPAWMDDIDAEWRRITLLHEQQHLQAGDARLMFAAVLATVLQPWNVALWWQLRRLRQAIELDCDRRVLNAGIDIRTYSELLIEINRRRMPAWFPVVALSNVRTFLARRITIMADHLTRTRHVKALVAAAAGIVLIALGCHAPSPLSVNDAADSVVADVKLVAEPRQDSTEFVTLGPRTVIHVIPRIRISEDSEIQSLLAEDSTRKVLHVKEEGREAHVTLDLVRNYDPAAKDPELELAIPIEVHLELAKGEDLVYLKSVRVLR